MTAIKHTLFVYGTLKRAYGNHRLLAEGDATFVGVDYAPGRVYGSNAVPVATPGDDGEWIKGEVFEVDAITLARCDRLEGHPNGYTRTAVTLRSGKPAEIYYWSHNVWDMEPIVGGEWAPLW